MGTNYYLQMISNICEYCGRSDESERQHIGKSSAGWAFALHVDPSQGINDLSDWIARWSAPGAVINDEYGAILSTAEMLQKITNRSWPETGHRSRMTPDELAQYLADNHAAQGPNNLMRHQLGDHCVKHGDGTWDCVTGEFS